VVGEGVCVEGEVRMSEHKRWEEMMCTSRLRRVARVIGGREVEKVRELGALVEEGWRREEMKASGDWWKERLWVRVVNMLGEWGLLVCICGDKHE
jgi:hypothetical protein